MRGNRGSERFGGLSKVAVLISGRTPKPRSWPHPALYLLPSRGCISETRPRYPSYLKELAGSPSVNALRPGSIAQDWGRQWRGAMGHWGFALRVVVSALGSVPAPGSGGHGGPLLSVSFTTCLFHSSISSPVNRSLSKMFSIPAGYFYPFIRVISFGK